MSAAEGYPDGEAGHRISQAAASQATVLDLAGLELTAVPGTIGQLTSLTSLWLGGNRLTAIPDTIGQLTSLAKLGLDDNLLSSPPAEVIARDAQEVVAFLRASTRGGR